MKFIKSNFAKKLTIILIAIIVFNAVAPTPVRAEDWFASSVLKPFTGLLASIVGSVDIFIGCIFMDTGGLDWQIYFDDIWHGDTDGDGNVFGDELYKTTSKDENGNKIEVTKEANAGELCFGADSIIKGSGIFNADVFDDGLNDQGQIEGGMLGETRNQVRNVVANFYVILRDLSALIMLVGLLYIGIQILINSNIPTKKTMYMTLLQDWIIGLCLLMFSHVIMRLIFYVGSVFTGAFSGALSGDSSATNINSILLEKLFNVDGNSGQIMMSWIYLIIIGLIIYETVFFAISYFKRTMFLNILVIFAPIFSAMYGFGSQQKQLYSKWLKEFVLLVLIQPFHILVYYVLIIFPIDLISQKSFNLGTAMYVILAILFIRPLEAWLREMVGFGGASASISEAAAKKTRDEAIKAWRGSEGKPGIKDDIANSFVARGLYKASKHMFKSVAGDNDEIIDKDNNQDDTIPDTTASIGITDEKNNASGSDYVDDVTPEELATQAKAIGQEIEKR